MAVRITGGKATGRITREPIPKGVRPTGARVREALFSMVGQDLTGLRFLDAYGGAGLVGIEAWSRGAEVVVVEQNRQTFRSLVRRSREISIDWTMKQGDVLSFGERLGDFDIVFVDPPYELAIEPIAHALAPHSRDWLVLEVEERTDAPARIGDHVLERVKPYGRATLWLYRREAT